MKVEPHGQRRGWLKNGNRPGDLTKAARCGAKTRRKTACQAPAMPNGRCRMHGGLSTGPRTAAGIEAIRRSRTVHGYYSQQALALRQAARTNRQAANSIEKGFTRQFRTQKAPLPRHDTDARAAWRVAVLQPASSVA